MNTGTIWLVIAVVAVICIAMRAAGPMILRDHDLPPRATAVIDALAPALLAGLIVVDMVGAHWREIDWTMLPALPVAAGLRWVQVPELACVLVAMGVTIVLRALADG